MTGAVGGAALGLMTGTGLVLIAQGLLAARGSGLALRVLPYLHDIPGTQPLRPSESAGRALLGRLAAGSRRPWAARARSDADCAVPGLAAAVHDFRIEQVVWGLACFAAMTAVAVPVGVRNPDRTVPLVVLCGVAFVFGVMLRDNRLSAQVVSRERRMLAEFPTVAELLALSVAAGEGPVAALERVVGRCRGALADELADVLAEIRTGTPVVAALDALAGRSGLPIVARFVSGMAVAIERGTPLADVLHAQAADVREAQRRSLIESGARREVFMMVPVVFLVLPVTVVFAFWPGLVGLRLVTS